MKDFKKLEIWHRGMELADLVYDVIDDIPWQISTEGDRPHEFGFPLHTLQQCRRQFPAQ